MGYSNEEAIFLGSFIQAERGIQYTLSQTYYGDEENNISPNTEFVNLMNNQYKDVWEVAQRIEGLCVGVGSHAGGVIISAKDLVESTALMKTASGDIITQYDLHKVEKVGDIKFDVLNIDALEKIHTELNLLLEDGYIEWQGDLKSTYEKYLGVYNIERDNQDLWEMIRQHKIMSLFQFEKQSGYQAIELGKPKRLAELTALNSVMRLMAQEGQTESPLQIYQKHRQDINTWYQEMDEQGLTKDEQEILKKYALDSYGLIATQEQFMAIVQEPSLGGWDLIYGDKLRKAVAKKKPKEFIELQEKFFERMKEQNLSENLCRYVWSLVSQSKGYSFNSAHTLSYSIVGLQEANLAYHYPIVYWNCANLISDSGGTDSTVKYGKIATAIGKMRKEGIKVVLPDINRTRFDFRPDAENNEIVYGLKAISGIGTAIAQAIVEHQPYESMEDFYQKMQSYKASSEEAKFGDTAMIQLIKAGCFDKLENKPREEIMKDFITKISKPLKKLDVGYIETLNELNLLTPEQKNNELKIYQFKKRVFTKANLVRQAGKSLSTGYYRVDQQEELPYFQEVIESYLKAGDYEINEETNETCVKLGAFDRVFDKFFEDFKQNCLTNQKFIDIINQKRFQAIWDERATGTVSQWEMDSLNYYYHEHELENVDTKAYDIISFDDMPEEPEIASHYFYMGKEKPRFVLHRLCGTVIDKDKNHNTITLLTPTGVAVVRLYKGQFGFYDREISEVDMYGNKHKIEKSWFKRGTKLLVTGFRSGEQFIPRQYNNSIYRHTIQLIKDVNPNGELSLQSERKGINNEENGAVGI